MLVVINSINAKVNLKHSANSVINKDSTNIQDRKKIDGLGINGVFKNFDSIAKSSKRSDHDQTTNEIVMKLKTGYDISDVKEILNRHKSFYFLRQVCIMISNWYCIPYLKLLVFCIGLMSIVVIKLYCQTATSIQFYEAG